MTASGASADTQSMEGSFVPWTEFDDFRRAIMEQMRQVRASQACSAFQSQEVRLATAEHAAALRKRLQAIEARLATVEHGFTNEGHGSIITSCSLEQDSHDMIDAAASPVQAVTSVEELVQSDGNLSCPPDASPLATSSLLTAPLNFHQAAAFYVLQADAPFARKACWLGSSLLLVVVQTICLLSLALAVDTPNCARHADCFDGQYCSASLCKWCGSEFDEMPDWAHHQNSTEFCLTHPGHIEACHICIEHSDQHLYGGHPEHGWDTTSHVMHVEANLRSMSWANWLAVFFSNFVVAMDITREMQDVALCQLSCLNWQGHAKKWSLWPMGLDFVAAVRQISLACPLFVLPSKITAYRGGSSLDVFFNTLAYLFILQVDNTLYHHLLSESTKAEVEVKGRVPLDEPAKLWLQRVRISYMSCVMMIPVGAFFLMGAATAAIERDGFGTLIILLLPFVASAFACPPRVLQRSLPQAIARWWAKLFVGGVFLYMIIRILD